MQMVLPYLRSDSVNAGQHHLLIRNWSCTYSKHWTGISRTTLTIIEKRPMARGHIRWWMRPFVTTKSGQGSSRITRLSVAHGATFSISLNCLSLLFGLRLQTPLLHLSGLNLLTLTVAERVWFPYAWLQIVDVHTIHVHDGSQRQAHRSHFNTNAIEHIVLLRGHVLNVILTVKGSCDLTNHLDKMVEGRDESG